MILSNFPKKLHEFEKTRLLGGVHAGGITIDPSQVMCSFNQNIGLLRLVLIILQ